MFVKVCGLRTPDDVDAAIAAGADAIGFVLTESARQVTPTQARTLAARIPPTILTVGVIAALPTPTALDITHEAGLQAIQLHGPYPRAAIEQAAATPFKVIRATHHTPTTDLTPWGADYLLLDSPTAGSGTPWNLSTLHTHPPQGPWLLAGGLTPETVAQAIAAARPTGVDVSSGVESSRGIKDPTLIHAFVKAAKATP
ncbi:phosphoribosylanthranilate isomerase [Actinokineospora inagensis]|uniref:phosphoribosylanthranilate isomerase n=1 Tax=Actinokineospora inagensis TaxID=103730 RepID=UPI000418994A|nr:phosphoribosylanthranilate isomerase [Actinokineospora inagensis]